MSKNTGFYGFTIDYFFDGVSNTEAKYGFDTVLFQGLDKGRHEVG